MSVQYKNRYVHTRNIQLDHKLIMKKKPEGTPRVLCLHNIFYVEILDISIKHVF